jgi:hypothetical protein
MAAMRPPVSSLDAGQAWLLPPLPTEGGRYVFELPASAGALLLFAFRPIQLGRLLGAPWATREQLPEAGASRSYRH